MIIVNLMGGLGNQMFQYAVAKHLSIINNAELKIDGSRFDKFTLNKEHTLQLESFNIAARQATGREIQQLIGPTNRVAGIANFISGLFRSASHGRKGEMIYREPDGSHFKTDVLGLGGEKYLIGYFNSYKYFDRIKGVLLNEYTPRGAVSLEGQRLLRLIESTNSVSIHIRRGDYVADPEIHKCIEGIITDQYYQNAVNHMALNVDSPHFFVFSNDMAWVKDHFKIPYEMTCVDFNSPQRGFEDLWLMSRCKHNITAGGSTFSWWAAYLNPNPAKIVVRTEQVSNDPKYNHPEDYFPQEWVSVRS